MTSYQTQKEENRKLNNVERSENKPIIESLPLVAKIEVTTRCNLKCVMCRHSSDKWKVKDFDRTLFDKLEVIFPTLLSVYLYGIGEVLTYPHAMELFRQLLSYGINVGFLTNAFFIASDGAINA